MDKSYWNDFYKVHGKDENIIEKSTFADFCSNKYFDQKKLRIVDLGTGNGRDAIFFAKHGHIVHAIDQSATVMRLREQISDSDVAENIYPRSADFIKEDYTQYGKIDAFYSRFTIHSITKDEEIILMSNVYKTLENKGLFCIEVRSTKDPKYGIGEACEKDTYINDGHKRRFINSEDFRDQVLNLGFKELYFTESDNLSIYKDDNPVLIRIILEK